MISPELGTIIASILSLAAGWAGRHLMGNKNPSPVMPDKAPDPTPAPAQPDGSSDQFSKLPGIPGHPVLNLIWRVLPNWFSKTKSVQSDGDAVIDDVAITALASAIKADPDRLAKMKSLLG